MVTLSQTEAEWIAFFVWFTQKQWKWLLRSFCFVVFGTLFFFFYLINISMSWQFSLTGGTRGIRPPLLRPASKGVRMPWDMGSLTSKLPRRKRLMTFGFFHGSNWLFLVKIDFLHENWPSWTSELNFLRVDELVDNLLIRRRYEPFFTFWSTFRFWWRFPS